MKKINEILEEITAFHIENVNSQIESVIREMFLKKYKKKIETVQDKHKFEKIEINGMVHLYVDGDRLISFTEPETDLNEMRTEITYF